MNFPFKNIFINRRVKSLPMQERPSAASVYPLLQEHVKEPAVLVQTWVQLSDFNAHSSISEGVYSYFAICNNYNNI